MVIVTQAEEVILRILWMKSPRTLDEISREVSMGRNWTKHAVEILTTRLMRKKAISEESHTGLKMYSAQISPDDAKVVYHRGLWNLLTDNEAVLLVNTKKPVGHRQRKE